MANQIDKGRDRQSEVQRERERELSSLEFTVYKCVGSEVVPGYKVIGDFLNQSNSYRKSLAA